MGCRKTIKLTSSLVSSWRKGIGKIKRNQKYFRYIIGIIFLFIVLQYGFNVFFYVQYHTAFAYRFFQWNGSAIKVNHVMNSSVGLRLYVGRKHLKTMHLPKEIITNKKASDDYVKSSGTGLIFRIMKLLGFSDMKPSPSPLPLCPKGPPESAGRIHVRQQQYKEEELNTLFMNDSITGGRWKPRTCAARHKIAIIVPYRNRERELGIFLRHMHPFLQRQQVHYSIYIIEQTYKSLFNRGLLMNIGFQEAMDQEDFDCVVLHDVDMLPEDDRILYDPPKQPRHLSVAGSRWGYKLPYKTFFGGVTAFRPQHYRQINGFSNIYFGWGAEDDDFYQRVKAQKLNITRYPASISRYNVLKHKQAQVGQQRMTFLREAKRRIAKDGLNDLNNLEYKIIKKEDRKLYSWILVDVNSTSVVNHIRNISKHYSVSPVKKTSISSGRKH